MPTTLAYISNEAASGAVVIVKASEILRDGWQPSTEPLPGADEGAVRIWRHELSGALFPDAYNPCGIANVPGDWSWLDTKHVDMGPYFRRRGMIFVDGRPLEPVEQHRELGNVPLPSTPQAAGPPRNGLPARTRGGPILQEVGGSPDGRFWVEHQGNVVHIRVPSGDPASSVIESHHARTGLRAAAERSGVHPHQGPDLSACGQRVSAAAARTGFDRGGHHWIIEGNTIEWANGVGLDIGASTGAARAIRWRATRTSCAATPSATSAWKASAAWARSNTLIEDNLIEWVGWQDAERAWEAAGAKFHRAHNLLFRRNVVRHIRHANALWLDVGNSNSRITANVFADVLTVSAAIHMEMSRAPNQID